jgi:hypothetical protein
MSLRMQDPVPDWISHVAFVRPGGQVLTGPKGLVLQEIEDHPMGHSTNVQADGPVKLRSNVPNSQKAILVDLQRVNVSYHGRHVKRPPVSKLSLSHRWFLAPGSSGHHVVHP